MIKEIFLNIFKVILGIMVFVSLIANNFELVVQAYLGLLLVMLISIENKIRKE